MPLYERLTRVEDRYWRAKTVEHKIGEKRLSKNGNVYVLFEDVNIFSIKGKKSYIILDENSNKYVINPEAWDLMKEL